MALTPEELVGYLRAEFTKASKNRVWLFIIQLLVVVPSAVSVLISDEHKKLLYVLSIAGIALLIAWWILNARYLRVRGAAQAARRGALLMQGLTEALSASEIQILRERFTVSADKARCSQKSDYYASTRPRGMARLAEILEESTFYSEHLQRISSRAMLGVLLFFMIIFLLVALAVTPFIERDTVYLVMRAFFASVAFAMSADVLGAFQAHKAAAIEIREIRRRLMNADSMGFPTPDILMAFADYNAAVESAPESVPLAYAFNAKNLESRWNDYQADKRGKSARS